MDELERLYIAILADIPGLKKSLEEAVTTAQQTIQQVNRSVSQGVSNEFAQSAQRTKRALDPLTESANRLNREALALRAAYQANIITQEELRSGLERVNREVTKNIAGLDSASEEYGKLARAGRTATASLDLIEGRLPKLGLAANVAAANVQSLGPALNQLGPIGTRLGLVVDTLSSAFAKSATEASSASLGISAFANVQERAAADALRFRTALLGAGLAATAFVAIAGGLAVALTTIASRAAEVADEIDKGSQRLGTSIETYQEISFVLDQFGASTDRAERAVNRITRNLTAFVGTGKEATSVYARLGVNIRDLNGELRDTGDIFLDTVAALQGIENETQRAVLANEALGRSAQELRPLLNGAAGSVDELRQKARDFGLIISGDAVISLVQFKDELAATRRAFQVVGVELSATLLPLLQQGLFPVLQQFILPALQRVSRSATTLLSNIKNFNELLPETRSQLIQTIAPIVQVVAGANALGAAFNIANISAQLAGASIRQSIVDAGNAIQNAPDALLTFLGLAPGRASGGGGRGGFNAVDDLREQLTAAQADLSRQLEILQNPASAVESILGNLSDAANAAAGSFGSVDETLDSVATQARSAADVLRDLESTLRAIDTQAELFPNFDADSARIDAVRSSLVELTRLGLGVASDAVQQLRAQYRDLGGDARDLAQDLQRVRTEQVALARSFTSKLALQVEFGFLDVTDARTQLEQAINNLQTQIAGFAGVSLDTEEARAELDALVERLGIARQSLDSLNRVALDPARLNLSKLSADALTGRQSIDQVRSQLELLLTGLERKLNEISADGLTELEILPFLDTARLIEQVRQAIAEAQNTALQQFLLPIELGIVSPENARSQIVARLNALRAEIEQQQAAIALDIELGEVDTTNQQENLRRLKGEAEDLEGALRSLRTEQIETTRAFARSIELQIEFGLADPRELQGALERELAQLKSQIDGFAGQEVTPELEALITQYQTLAGVLQLVIDAVAKVTRESVPGGFALQEQLDSAAGGALRYYTELLELTRAQQVLGLETENYRDLLGETEDVLLAIARQGNLTTEELIAIANALRSIRDELAEFNRIDLQLSLLGSDFALPQIDANPARVLSDFYRNLLEVTELERELGTNIETVRDVLVEGIAILETQIATLDRTDDAYKNVLQTLVRFKAQLEEIDRLNIELDIGGFALPEQTKSATTALTEFYQQLLQTTQAQEILGIATESYRDVLREAIDVLRGQLGTLSETSDEYARLVQILAQLEQADPFKALEGRAAGLLGEVRNEFRELIDELQTFVDDPEVGETAQRLIDKLAAADSLSAITAGVRLGTDILKGIDTALQAQSASALVGALGSLGQTIGTAIGGPAVGALVGAIGDGLSALVGIIERFVDPQGPLRRQLQQQFAAAISSGFSQGLRDALDSDDPLTEIYTRLRGTLENAILDSFINQALVQAALGPLLRQLANAALSGNEDAVRQILGQLGQTIRTLGPELLRLARQLRSDFDAIFPETIQTRIELEPDLNQRFFDLPNAVSPIVSTPQAFFIFRDSVNTFRDSVNFQAENPQRVVVEFANGGAPSGAAVRGL